MLSFKRMRQQSRPIHCKHLSLIESTTARVTLQSFQFVWLVGLYYDFDILDSAGQNKQHSSAKDTAKLDRETEELHRMFLDNSDYP